MAAFAPLAAEILDIAIASLIGAMLAYGLVYGLPRRRRP